MTNPRVVVPRIEELIELSSRERAGNLSLEDAKRFEVVRLDLTRYFERIESEIGVLKLKQHSQEHSA